MIYIKNLLHLPDSNDLLFIDIYSDDTKKNKTQTILSIVLLISSIIAVFICITNVIMAIVVAIIVCVVGSFLSLTIIDKINNCIYKNYKERYFKEVDNVFYMYEYTNPDLFNNISYYIYNKNPLIIHIRRTTLYIEAVEANKKELFIYDYNGHGYKNINNILQGVFAKKIIKDINEKKFDYTVDYGGEIYDEVIININKKEQADLKDW